MTFASSAEIVREVTVWSSLATSMIDRSDSPFRSKIRWAIQIALYGLPARSLFRYEFKEVPEEARAPVRGPGL